MSDYSSTVCKDGDRYRVMYRYTAPDGKRKSSCKRGFKLHKDAKKWEKEELPSLIKQLEHEETLDENLTMAELVKEYMNFTRLRRRDTTAENKKNIIDKKILPYFENKKVYEISTNDVRKWQDEVLSMKKSNGEEYSSTYLRSINNQLSAILNYAVVYHNLPSNPVLKIERLGTKQADKEREFWTLDEYTKFSNVIREKPEFYYAFQVFFWCGLRLGELQALTREDVNLHEMTLKVTNSFTKKEQTNGKTKTPNSKRTVHMPKELAEELEEYINSLYGIKSTDRLFEISKSAFHKTMTAYSKKAGVKRITIHGLRHSHISLLMNYVSCASVMDIAKRAGHKSPEITMIYSHRYGNKDALIAEQLDEMMRGDSDVGKK